MIFDFLASTWIFYLLKCQLIWEVSLNSHLVYYRWNISFRTLSFPEHSQFCFYRVSKSTSHKPRVQKAPPTPISTHQQNKTNPFPSFPSKGQLTPIRHALQHQRGRISCPFISHLQPPLHQHSLLPPQTPRTPGTHISTSWLKLKRRRATSPIPRVPFLLHLRRRYLPGLQTCTYVYINTLSFFSTR